MSLAESIKKEASRLGFDAVGFASVPIHQSLLDPPYTSSTDNSLPTTLYARLIHWLAEGYHATMEWMDRHPDRRSHPAFVLPECRSIISVGLNYFTHDVANESQENGRIARYAWGQDYHNVFKKRLKLLEEYIKTLAPDAQTKWYVDTGPIMEKAWAQEAGLGWIGKHSNLVSSDFGSWLLLGEILTTLELSPDVAGTDLCGSCTLCIDACPTGAIVEPYVVNAETCISYLTIEYRGEEEELSEELKKNMGNRIFGCDDCLDICPYNNNRVATTESAFYSNDVTIGPNLSRMNILDKATFNDMFRFSPIRRAKHEGFRRNIHIAQRNANHSEKSNAAPPS
ncbi:MAG: tRNA epoxyqueuosine(34) reductase QueG [Nitrospirales bacterium]